MPLFVDEILRDDAMRHLRNTRWISPGGIDLDPFESIAQFLPQAFESFGRTKRIVGKAEPENLAAPILHSVANHFEILVRNMQSAFSFRAKGKGQRRLGQDRRHDRLVDHQGEPEISSQTHADTSDAGATALFVGLARQRPQPFRNRARPA